ncbi:hypothetical protein K469DRAFT_688470 [Zopfia rhizophila CBS 207.26]|uniref:Uncharacterized protein n=1 Tax=Zopfia rhizophila CBS 207.26 TaxID=1314779 RepID=A0A6A6DZ80_9PEZI|nr:hypothetical protein K469DRAFT_688470 [Zopfia rhizophila CBS 207.26]
MYYGINLLVSTLLFVLSALGNPLDDAVPARTAEPNPVPLIRNVYARQEVPTSYTTSRAGNTDFAPPVTNTPSSTTPASVITSLESNNEIFASSGTGSAPPLVTTDSESANTKAVGPSTVSSALAAPTGAMRMDVVLGGVVVGLAGMV